MKTEFKKWLCEKSGYNYDNFINVLKDKRTLEILIKAMWACQGKEVDKEIEKIKKYLQDIWEQETKCDTDCNTRSMSSV